MGAYVLAATVSLGLGEVVTRSVAVFTAVKLAGAAYLVFLGVKAWRHRGELSAAVADSDPAGSGGPAAPRPRAPAAPDDAGDPGDQGTPAARPAARGDLRTLWEGFVVGVTNPKTCVFFAAVLPQFVAATRAGCTTRCSLLALVFTVVALVCDSVWALTAAAARGWFARSPRRMAAVGGTGGLAMIGLGVAVAVTGRADS